MATPRSIAPPNWSGRNWDALPIQEKAVQWAAFFADHERVREIPRNRGFWVEQFLARVGLGPGYAWCAAFTSELVARAGWHRFRSAAVLRWRAWAERESRVRTVPQRGSLALWVRGSGASQRRHIEIVITTPGGVCPTFVHPSGKVPIGFLQTIGGNTSSGASGSQEDGDGVYRRLRRTEEFTAFIHWW